MKSHLLLYLVILAFATCKDHTGNSSNNKLLLTEEDELFEHRKTMAYDTFGITKYRYDQHNRLIFKKERFINIHVTNYYKYYYNKNDQLIRTEEFYSNEPVKSMIINYYYKNGVPLYSTRSTSPKDTFYYTVKNNKVIKMAATNAGYSYDITYNGRNAVITSIDQKYGTGKNYLHADTNIYGRKHNPMYGVNIKWQSLEWGMWFPDNEIIQEKQFCKEDKGYAPPHIDNNYSYEYNEQGYPTKRTGFISSLGVPTSTPTVIYKYIPVH